MVALVGSLNLPGVHRRRHYIGLRGMRGDLVLQGTASVVEWCDRLLLNVVAAPATVPANRANHVHYGNVLSRTWPYQCVAVLVEAPTAMVVAMIPFVPSSASAGPDGADWANPQIM